LGDLNVDLDRLKNSRADTIAAQIVIMALEDIGDYFPHPRGRWTWSQGRHDGNYLRSKTCYIMAQEITDFKRWAIKIPRYDTDHRAILAEMHLSKAYIHRSYVCSRRSLPPFPLQRPLSQNDARFENLKQYHEIPDPAKAKERSWISKVTWKLIDK